MSGFLLGSGLASLAGLPTMFLGPVAFSGFEVPNTINWGTKQLIKEHVYAGGQNTLQAMGPTRAPIHWSGQMFDDILRGAAADRARTLDQLCAAGGMVPLDFGDFSFDVLVEDFEADYKHQWWMGHYTVRVRVLWDYQQGQTPDTPAVSGANDLGAPAAGNFSSTQIAAAPGLGTLYGTPGT